ncbi:MAG: hypothetical protein Q7T83_12380 [Thermodesulfovibrionales bacterium]|nr:hypothetical protein [Thermodesulfovibrionales bacterium]
MVIGKKNEDGRREFREQILGHVSCSYASETNEPNFDGIIIDVSNAGLGIFTHKPVTEGAGLKIHGEGLWENSKHATVKWCRKIASDIYRAGIVFN